MSSIGGNLTFLEAHNLTLVATTNFIQSDGSTFSSGTVLVTWLNLYPNITIKTNN